MERILGEVNMKASTVGELLELLKTVDPNSNGTVLMTAHLLLKMKSKQKL
jgi:hypothetical protein